MITDRDSRPESDDGPMKPMDGPPIYYWSKGSKHARNDSVEHSDVRDEKSVEVVNTRVYGDGHGGPSSRKKSSPGSGSIMAHTFASHEDL